MLEICTKIDNDRHKDSEMDIETDNERTHREIQRLTESERQKEAERLIHLETGMSWLDMEQLHVSLQLTG